MFPAIDRLARDVEDAWGRGGYAEADFSAISTELLDRPLVLDFETLARGVSEGARLPQQRRLDQDFGQPGITLYHGERFLIEALCWLTGTPAIHHHAFSGAFRVLTGRSVHSRYAYSECDRLGPVSIGTLELVRAEVLNAASVVAIPRGADLIHANFHLDSPTMTLVVRTHQGREPELTYLPPGVAYDSAARTPALQKQIELLDTTHQVAHPLYQECLIAAIEHADIYDGMAIVMRAGARVEDPVFRELVNRFRQQHGERSAPLVSALHEERRRGMIMRLRGTMTDAESRFFLAVLLSFSRRQDLLDTMAAHYGDAATARARVASGVAGLFGGHRDRRLISAAAAQAMLDDLPAAAFSQSLAHLWQRTLSSDESRLVCNYYQQVCNHPLLTPLATREYAS